MVGAVDEAGTGPWYSTASVHRGKGEEELDWSRLVQVWTVWRIVRSLRDHFVVDQVVSTGCFQR